MSREPKQERAEIKRRQVLEATLRLLASEGPRGVTHRAVAAEAGTSVRATTYYFASRDELLREALVHYTRTAIARFDVIAASFDAEGTPHLSDDPLELAADLMAATVVSDLVDDRAGLVAEYELVLEIGRSPAFEAAYRGWQRELEVMLAGYASLFGSAHPERDARIFLATMRGLEMEALARPSEKPNRGELRELFRVLLASLSVRPGGPAGTTSTVLRASRAVLLRNERKR